MSREKEHSVLESVGGDAASPRGMPRASSPIESVRGPAQTRARAPLYDTVESAAAKLGLEAEALRARCRRAARQVGASVESHLGGGIVAFKFGRSWRVRFPSV